MPVNHEAFKRLRTAAEAFNVSSGDIAGPILVRLGQEHRRQVAQNFASEGATGGTGRWAELSPGYQAWKRRQIGGRGKILTLKGEMKSRFVSRSSPHYIQRYVPPVVQFGARSKKAAAHFTGRAFPPMPSRDLITKSAKQLKDLQGVIFTWYRKERLPQIQRNNAKAFSAANASFSSAKLESRLAELRVR